MKKTVIKAENHTKSNKRKREVQIVKFGPKASRLRTQIIKAVRAVVAERESRQAG